MGSGCCGRCAAPATAATSGQYRKKPVVIDAIQWDGSWDSKAAIEAAFPEMEVCAATLHPPSKTVRSWSIRTLEGSHAVSVGDWIIKGIKGEFYPCKPDVFAATYEPTAAPAAPAEPTADEVDAAPMSHGALQACVILCAKSALHRIADGRPGDAVSPIQTMLRAARRPAAPAAAPAEPVNARLLEALRNAEKGLHGAWQMLSAIAECEPSRDRIRAAEKAGAAWTNATAAIAAAEAQPKVAPLTPDDAVSALRMALQDMRAIRCPVQESASLVGYFCNRLRERNLGIGAAGEKGGR